MTATKVQRGPAPKVTLNKWPSWLLKRIRAAIRDGRIPKPNWPNESGWALVQHVMGYDLIWDHWGRCGNLLVTEPYADVNGSEVRRQCRRFAKVLDLAYTVSSESNWNPPGTIRIEFRELTTQEITAKLQREADKISARHRAKRSERGSD